MARPQRLLRDAQAELALFRRRALFAFLLASVAIMVLAGRFAWLQVVLHEEYLTRSEANRIKLRPIVPARGLIYDRNGKLLADNVPAYRLELIREQVVDIDGTLGELAQILPISEEELERFRTNWNSQRRFQPVPLKFRLSEAELARFAVNRHRFRGVDVVPYLTRRYPYGEMFSHVIGYVSRIDSEDAGKLDPARYSGTTHIGKSGIERYYEDRLHGEIGLEHVEVNAEGRTLRVLERTPASAGEHLYLSVDAELQQAAVAAFEGQHGAAVAIDPRNGEVLALVSLPGYDPNPFVNGIARADYAALLKSESRPLFNRALNGGYEPGSTIKPFIALAALELGIRQADQRVLSTGAFTLPGQEREYRDWRKGGHGYVDLREALAQSVNTYFYGIAVDVGIDRLSGYLGRFGFGAPTGIDIGGDAPGVLPSREWKRASRKQVWYPGETVISGIGQGFWVTTPLQLAQATALLAAGGRSYRPRMLRAAQRGFDAEVVAEPAGEMIGTAIADAAHLRAVTEGMVAVMHGPTGTARAAATGAEYQIAGKTGTAQRVGRTGDEAVDLDSLPFHLRNRALFIAFAPAWEPRIAVAVVVESGGSGSLAAAPVARRILDAWLLRGLTQ